MPRTSPTPNTYSFPFQRSRQWTFCSGATIFLAQLGLRGCGALIGCGWDFRRASTFLAFASQACAGTEAAAATAKGARGMTR